MIINSSDLTVLSVIEGSVGLAALMVESIERFTKPSPSIIVANQNINKITKNTFEKNPIIKVVDSLPGKTKNTSLRHARGLNTIMPHVNTTYSAIVESDCVVLREDWFDFDTDKYDMMASLKCNQLGEEQYHVCFLVFKTELLKGMDWSPSEATKPRDTGHRIFSHIGGKTERIKYLQIKSKKQARIFQQGFEYKTFEAYKDDGMPIAAHFGRGSDLGRRPTNKLGVAKLQVREWSKTYREFVNSLNGKSEVKI
jgi:hypothetical protein